MRTFLAIDLGTITGWACSRNGLVTSGTEEFRNGRFSGGGMRYLAFSAWLDKTYGLLQPNAIFFEEVRRHLGIDAAHIYGGFSAHLTAFCEAHKIPYQGVPIGTIKRHITGRGNADKTAVIAAVKARGFAPADDNEADALALLSWVLAQ